MTNPRQLCDAYFRAMIPRKEDDSVSRRHLSEIPLPPPPANPWFWERVAEQFDKWSPEEEEHGS